VEPHPRRVRPRATGARPLARQRRDLDAELQRGPLGRRVSGRRRHQARPRRRVLQQRGRPTGAKQQFFRGGDKVLVTSTRGTLTEGVDYDGAKLSTCAVVGVPLVNIGSPRVRAVQRAYGDVFGEDDAFEYALTVPAVRRARQAIGRVIRGADEVGVPRVRRPAVLPRRAPLRLPFLPEEEREEFTRMTPEFLAEQIDRFWDGQ